MNRTQKVFSCKQKEIGHSEETYCTSLSFPRVPVLSQKVEGVIVKHVESPNYFYLTTLRRELRFQSFDEDLQKHYGTNSSSVNTNTLPIGSFWCVYHNDHWKRGQIVKFSSSQDYLMECNGISYFKVFMVDYGYTEVISVKDFAFLSKKFFAPPFINLCCLYKMSPCKPDENGSYSEHHSDIFKFLVESKEPYIARFMERTNGKYAVVLETLKLQVTENLVNFKVVRLESPRVLELAKNMADNYMGKKTKESQTSQKKIVPKFHKMSLPKYEINCNRNARVCVYVRHIVSPLEFYVMFKDNENEFERFNKRLQDCYKKTTPKPRNIKLSVGDYCCVYEQSIWKRAQIMAINRLRVSIEEYEYSLLFVDYGTSYSTGQNSLVVLHKDFFSQKPFVVQCSLADITPVNIAADDYWLHSSMIYFKSLVQMMNVHYCYFIEDFGSHLDIILETSKGQNLNETLFYLHEGTEETPDTFTGQTACKNEVAVEASKISENKIESTFTRTKDSTGTSSTIQHHHSAESSSSARASNTIEHQHSAVATNNTESARPLNSDATSNFTETTNSNEVSNSNDAEGTFVNNNETVSSGNIIPQNEQFSLLQLEEELEDELCPEELLPIKAIPDTNLPYGSGVPLIVTVTHIHSPLEFYVRTEDLQIELESYAETLHEFCSENHLSPSVNRLPPGSCWAALHKGIYKRVKVLRNWGKQFCKEVNKKEPMFEVLFVDYGYQGLVPLFTLTYLEDRFVLDSPFAITCLLVGNKPKEPTEYGEYTPKARNVFRSLTPLDSIYLCYFAHKTLSLKYAVVLENEKADTINELLVRDGVSFFEANGVKYTDYSEIVQELSKIEEKNPSPRYFIEVVDPTVSYTESSDTKVTDSESENNNSVCESEHRDGKVEDSDFKDQESVSKVQNSVENCDSDPIVETSNIATVPQGAVENTEKMEKRTPILSKALENWDPMLEDFNDPQSLWKDNESAEMVISGFRTDTTPQICNYFKYGKECKRGENCRYLHEHPRPDGLPAGSVPVHVQLGEREPLEYGVKYGCAVSNITDPGCFYVALWPTPSYYRKMNNTLQRFYKNTKFKMLPQFLPAIGELVCILTKENNKWFRARILAYLEYVVEPKFEVFIIDTGDIIQVEESCVRPLVTQFIDYPPLAVQSSLHGIRPNGDSWSEDAIELFKEFVGNGGMKVTVMQHDEMNDKITVELFYDEDDDQVFISDGLIDEQLALIVED